MNKYLDLAIAHMGRPRHVIFLVWDADMGGRVRPPVGCRPADAGFPGSGYGGAGGKEFLPKDNNLPLKVSFLDPATGAVTEGEGPSYADPQAREFWKPFVAGIGEELRKRGLEKTVVLGLFGDAQPLKEVTAFWHETLPDAPWASSGHVWLKQLHGSPVAFATAWRWDGTYSLTDPAVKRVTAWRDDRTVAAPYRIPLPNCTPGDFADLYERNLNYGQDGLGRLFADFFPVAVSKNANSTSRLLGRYVATSWGTMNWGETWLVARPEGPATTVAMESIRGGIQDAEARIFIQDAILDQRAKLGEPLARKAQEALDERLRYLMSADSMSGAGKFPAYGNYWIAGGGWLERTESLYATAAEVAKALN
jgi:hypothetical protein